MLDKSDDMVPDYNCLAVDDEKSLAETITETGAVLINSIRGAGRIRLMQHEPKLIGKEYAEFLGLGDTA